MREADDPARLRQSLRALGERRRVLRRPPDVTSAYSETLAVVESVAGRADAPRRDTFLGSVERTSLREAASMAG